MMTGEDLGIALLMASTIPNNYTGVLPSGMTIRRFAAADEDREELRRGMWQGTIISFVEIAGATIVAGSFLPLVAGVLVMAYYLWYYVTALLNPHPSAVPIDQQG